jgi:hypothetical protein
MKWWLLKVSRANGVAEPYRTLKHREPLAYAFC